MARRLKLEITETAAYLEKSLKQAKSGIRKERLQMLWWLKTGQVKEHQELSRRLGRGHSTITRWLHSYRTGGLSQLLEVKTPPGAEPKIQGEALEKLKQRLDSPEGFSSYRAIVDWLEQECGLEVKYDTVNRFVREKLKAKLKVPRPQSLKQVDGTGWHFTQEYSQLNSENFQQFLNTLSEQLGNTVAVMQLDRASAHRSQDLEWPENIIPIFQPAHCPELNPIERFWQFLKSLWKGENFAALDALRQRVTHELQQLSVEQVQSLTSFDFILDALLQAAF